MISPPEKRDVSRAFSLEALTAPRLVLAALLILATWRAAVLFSGSPPHALPELPAREVAARPAGIDITGIQLAQLFGASPADQSATQNVAAASDLVLVGVLASQDPEIGYALLGPNANSIALYGAGAEVSAGLHLQSVYDSYVMLERGGQLVRLDLPELRLRGSGATQSMATTSASQGVAARSRRTVAQLRPNVPVMASQVFRTQVARVGGKFQGYRLLPGGDPQAFQKMGLQAGDVVVAVNGGKPNDAQGDFQQVLNSRRSARLTIVRGGAPLDLLVSLDNSRH